MKRLKLFEYPDVQLVVKKVRITVRQGADRVKYSHFLVSTMYFSTYGSIAHHESFDDAESLEAAFQAFDKKMADRVVS